jgi:hypothetical protein
MDPGQKQLVNISCEAYKAFPSSICHHTEVVSKMRFEHFTENPSKLTKKPAYTFSGQSQSCPVTELDLRSHCHHTVTALDHSAQ